MILEEKYLYDRSNITLYADIEGSLSEYKGYNSFGALINIKEKNKETIQFLHCNIPKPSKLEKNYEINCFIYLDNEQIFFESVSLSPYFYPKSAECPFVVINNIKNNVDIKDLVDEGESEDDDDDSNIFPFPSFPSCSKVINFTYLFIILISLLLF